MRSVDALQPESVIWTIAGELLPPERAFDWNQAVMDLGAMICTARSPRCMACPVVTVCRSRAFMGRAPRPRPKQEICFGGIPRRIYRGRVVELLRALPPGASLPAAELRRRLVPDSTRGGAAWLETVLEGLARDGIIVREESPAARTRRVRLAS